MSEQVETPDRYGTVLLDAIIEHDDAMGHLANATGDELRDALRIAATRLRVRSQRRPTDALLIGARWLVAEVWWLVQEHKIDARSRAADAALDLRDTIDTKWWPEWEKENPKWRAGEG